MTEGKEIPSIGIVGGGFSGVLAAIRILRDFRTSGQDVRVTLIERHSRVGRGVAYGTDLESHLLNVPVSKMSLFPEEPDHFQKWVAEGHPEAVGKKFLPRKLYGKYVYACLAETVKKQPDRFLLLHDSVTSWSEAGGKGRLEMEALGGEEFNSVVFATGYRNLKIPSELKAIEESHRLIVDPWKHGVLSSINADEKVMIIGTGLTMVDVTLWLLAHGHRGGITCVSRNGFIPRPHRDVNGVNEENPFRGKDFPTALSLFREFRDQLSKLNSPADEWSVSIDFLRTESQRVWIKWSIREKRRFLRHLRTRWDIHRHRMSPELYENWNSHRLGKRIDPLAGRIVNSKCLPDTTEVEVMLRLRDGMSLEWRGNRVINCMGAQPDHTLFNGPEFLRDPLELGIPTNAVGNPLRGDGTVLENIFILGPALRTAFWEMTAVPELRIQARRLVEALLLRG